VTAVEDAEHRELLAAIRRALRREAEVLAVHPELTWQQLHNRVQWAGSVVADLLDRERQRQTSARTWFWLQSPPTESRALMGVLGNTDSAFAFTPEGSMLIVTDGGLLQYLNLLTGMPTYAVKLDGTAGRPVVPSCAVSPDGSFMITATVQGLQLRRLPTGELLRTLEVGNIADDKGANGGTSSGRSGPPHLDTSPTGLPCAVSPDASFVVGTGPDHAVRIWDAATGQPRAAFTGHTKRVTACAVSADGSFVVSASADGTVRLWDPATGLIATIFAVFHGGRRPDPAAAPGSAADLGVEDPAVAGAGPKELWVATVNGCAIGPDASFLAGVSEDMVTVWDLPSGQVRWSDQHVGGARSCAVSPDGALVVSGGERGDLRVWDASSGAELCALSGHTGPVYACAVSPDAALIASRADDGIRLWDARARGERESLEGHGKRVTACRFDPAGDRLASAAADSTVVVWEARGRHRIASLEGHDDVVQDCAFTPDGRQLVSASRDGTVRVWDAGDGMPQRMFPARHPVWGCATRPDGGAVLFGWDKRPAQWDLQTGQYLLAHESPQTETWRCAFSPDGSWAVTSGGDGTLSVYDSESGEKRATLNGHTETAGVCAVSPDATFIVSGGADHTVRIWDAKTFRQRHLLEGHSNAVWGVAVSPDARVVASVSWDGSLRVWSSESGRELMRLGLPVSLTALAFHPWRPIVAFGDQAGWLHRVELMGLDPGPVIVTAHEADGALFLQCPACRTIGPVAESALDHVQPCPACGISLRLAASVLRPLPEPGGGRGHKHAILLAEEPGGDDERSRRLMSMMRRCACGTWYELLRYACPKCGSSMSLTPGSLLSAEANEFMDNRQALARLHTDRGVMLAKRGQHEEALAEYSKAIEANPWNATAHQNVGTALWQLGDLTEALRWFEKALDLDPRRALAAQMAALIRRVRSLEARARTEVQAGQRDTALADLTAAADLCRGSRYRQEIEQAIQSLSAR
jgi:WD40 repeat protein